MERHPVIEASDLCIGYKKKKRQVNKVHEHLQFALFPGELVCLLGPNGAGKSTLLRTIASFQPPLDGQLSLAGQAISAYSERELSRLIGIVLTDKTQTGGLTVQELVALGRQPHTGFFGRLKSRDHEIIHQAMESVGISFKAHQYMAELSDGERQKAMIAKALVQECPLILLDEPTAFLDVTSRIEIMQLLHAIARDQDKTVLMSTHDVEQALIFSDRLWLLNREGGLRQGVPEDLIFNREMDRLFSRESITFDAGLGAYTPRAAWKQTITVKAENDTLLHWTLNALHRRLYHGTTPQTGELPQLHVHSATNMTFRKEGKEFVLHSFAELMQVL